VVGAACSALFLLDGQARVGLQSGHPKPADQNHAMNIHHLELFYYVARHGGISQAVRNIPYGIQQPAVSAQIIRLEEHLGVKLFQRRPFHLTPQGDQLYQFIQPFFENIQTMADTLRGGIAQRIAIGASEIVLHDYLPGILSEMKRLFPKLKVTLREGYQPRLLAWLQERELDMALTLLQGKPPAGISSLALFKLPLVLLVPKRSKLKSAEDLWKQDRIEETLISVPGNEPICRTFQEGLTRLKVDWFTEIEVSNVDLVQTYVANGYGLGVSVSIPKGKYHPQVRLLPLAGFEPVGFGILWQGQMTTVMQALLELVQQVAKELQS
jgi:DNA-binding transcriptional LysR family regulator